MVSNDWIRKSFTSNTGPQQQGFPQKSLHAIGKSAKIKKSEVVRRIFFTVYGIGLQSIKLKNNVLVIKKARIYSGFSFRSFGCCLRPFLEA